MPDPIASPTAATPAAPVRARLHLPSPALGACVFLAAERDTRGVRLDDAQRFNHYPATPFPMLAWIFEGELRMVQDPPGSAGPRLGEPLPRLLLAGPSRRPTASWSPGPVHALSVALHPDAVAPLLGVRPEDVLDHIVPLEAVAPAAACERLLQVMQERADTPPYPRAEAALRSLWQQACPAGLARDVRGWLGALAVRAAFSGPGTGLRQVQRRIKAWTGQSHRELQLYARVERAFAGVAALPPGRPADMAAIAAEAGFADQSHLGREVRRVTGLSPARLDALIRTEESFWLYRLIEGNLRGAAG